MRCEKHRISIQTHAHASRRRLCDQVRCAPVSLSARFNNPIPMCTERCAPNFASACACVCVSISAGHNGHRHHDRVRDAAMFVRRCARQAHRESDVSVYQHTSILLFIRDPLSVLFSCPFCVRVASVLWFFFSLFRCTRNLGFASIVRNGWEWSGCLV